MAGGPMMAVIAVKPGIKIQNVINSQLPRRAFIRRFCCKARHKNTKCNQFTTVSLRMVSESGAVKPGIKIQNVINSQLFTLITNLEVSCKARHKNTKCNQFTTL